MRLNWKTMAGMAAAAAIAGAMLMPAPASLAAGKEETYARNTLLCLKLLFTDPKAHDEQCPGDLPVMPRSLEYGNENGGATPCVVQQGGSDGPSYPSDPCVKYEIMFLMEEGGLRFYSFKYIGDDQTFYGVMASDLMADPRFAPYVHLMAGGYYGVDYEGLGLTVPDSDAMRAAGERAMQIVAGRYQS